MGKIKAKAMELTTAAPPPPPPRSTLPTTQTGSRSVFTAYGESAAGSGYIVGDLLKYSKGDWLCGQENREVADGTTLVAIMDTLVVGWQRWQDQRPVGYRMGLLVEGFEPPRRDELGDNDRALWEIDNDGQHRDPWQPTNYLQLVAPDNQDVVMTYTTSSKGGLGAIAKLAREFGRAREREQREDQYPLVRLDSGSYAHRDRAFGRIKFPVFAVVGWVDKEDFTPIRDPIGDEIPF